MTTPRRVLSKAEVRRIVDGAYRRLADMVESDLRRDRLFTAAYLEAEGEERRERSSRGEERPYRQTALLAARYYVLLSIRRPRRVASALNATDCALSRLYGSALAELLSAEEQAQIFSDSEGFDAIDYGEHIAPEGKGT